MFCLSECVRSFKCHERQDIKTPRFVPFSLAEKCKPLKAETSCSCLGNLQLLRANVYIYSACEWIILGGGFSIYLWGKKYQKNWALFSFFFSFRKKYFKKLLLEFFYKIICIGISHEHTAASNTPIIFLLLQYLDLCLFHYVIRRVSSQLKLDSLTE